MTPDTPRYDKPVCDYDGCENEATVIWRNAMDIYCQSHADQFIAAEKRSAEIVADFRRWKRDRAR